MVKTKFKKAVSLVLAAVMSLTAFMGIGATTAFAAVGEKADVYLVDYPRSGDTNNNGEWGHGNLNYMNGWKGLSTKYTGLRAMGSYSGNIAYCIEPGTGQRTGDTLTEKDENFFNNISPNGTISGDDKNGQFTTKEYVCDNDWTIREITPSEGYLLDGTIHKVGAEPQLYTVEHNQTANDVTEQVMKGNIARRVLYAGCGTCGAGIQCLLYLL